MDALTIISDELKQRDRDRWLACLYVAAPARNGLIALLALDCELAHLAATTTESLLGEIRMAWWRDRLSELDSKPSPAQPLLEALQSHALPTLSGADLALLEDRWLCRLDDDGTDEAYVEGGGRLFALAARVLGGDPAEADALGRAWAVGDPVVGKTSAPLRPLRGLANLAVRDASHFRAGQPPEPRGGLARQWQLLKAVAFGR